MVGREAPDLSYQDVAAVVRMAMSLTNTSGFQRSRAVSAAPADSTAVTRTSYCSSALVNMSSKSTMPRNGWNPYGKSARRWMDGTR